MRPSLLRSTVFALASTWLAVGCARRSPAPAPPPIVAETIRTPDLPTPPAPPAAARDLADVMTVELKLTPAQTTQVRQILASTVADVNAARQQFPAKSAPLTAALQRINTSSEGQLRQALGAATYQEFQQKKRQIQAQLQQRQR